MEPTPDPDPDPSPGPCSDPDRSSKDDAHETPRASQQASAGTRIYSDSDREGKREGERQCVGGWEGGRE